MTGKRISTGLGYSPKQTSHSCKQDHPYIHQDWIILLLDAEQTSNKQDHPGLVHSPLGLSGSTPSHSPFVPRCPFCHGDDHQYQQS